MMMNRENARESALSRVYIFLREERLREDKRYIYSQRRIALCRSVKGVKGMPNHG